MSAVPDPGGVDVLWTLGVALELLVVAVGAVVAWQAYRGYRRNASRPMLFLAVAFAILAGGHALLRYPGTWSGLLGDVGAEIGIQVLDIAAVLLVGYALTRA